MGKWWGAIGHVGDLVTGNVLSASRGTTLAIARCQSILLSPRRAGSKSGWHHGGWVAGGLGQTRWHPIVKRGDIWIKPNTSRGKCTVVPAIYSNLPLKGLLHSATRDPDVSSICTCNYHIAFRLHHCTGSRTLVIFNSCLFYRKDGEAMFSGPEHI